MAPAQLKTGSIELQAKAGLWSFAANFFGQQIKAIYEFVKNQIDAKAKEIHVEVDLRTKTLYVYGNGEHVTPEIADHMFKKVFLSSKGLLNHGIGLYSFISLGTELGFVSKSNDILVAGKIDAETCTYELDPCTSINQMKQHQSDLVSVARKLSHLEQGSCWAIYSLGTNKDSSRDFAFNVSERFSEEELYQYFSKQFGDRLKDINLIIKVGDKKSIRVLPKKKTGKHIVSKPDEYLVEFEQGGRNFDLEVKYSLWFSSGDLMINVADESRLNMRDISGISGNRINVWRDTTNINCLSGDIEVYVTAQDGGEVPSCYNSDRSNLHWETKFGETLRAILLTIQEDKVKPSLSHVKKNKEEIKDILHGNAISIYIQRFLKDAKLPLFNTDLTEKYERRCKCGAILKIDRVKREVRCTECGWSQQIREYEKDMYPKEPTRHPNDIDTYKNPGDRIKEKGKYGFRFIEEKDINNPEPYSRYGSTVHINTAHPSYLKQVAEKSGNKTEYILTIAILTLTEAWVEQSKIIDPILIQKRYKEMLVLFYNFKAKAESVSDILTYASSSKNDDDDNCSSITKPKQPSTPPKPKITTEALLKFNEKHHL